MTERDGFDERVAAQPATQPVGRVGPIVMLVPALLFLLAVLVLKDRAPDPGPRPRPPIAGGRGDVPGWSGALDLAVPEGDARVTARLVRLHSEPGRQAFDARALRERLGLDAGEPWLLTIQLLAPREGPALADDLGLSVSGVRIADATGTALAPLPVDAAAGGGLADPLRTLLAPASDVVRPGQTVNVFLWGREPGAAVELIGLPSPAPGPLALAPKALGRSDDALASLDRASGEEDEGGRR